MKLDKETCDKLVRLRNTALRAAAAARFAEAAFYNSSLEALDSVGITDYSCAVCLNCASIIAKGNKCPECQNG